MEHILFLTGRLAEPALRRVLADIAAPGADAPFAWEVREIGLQVAALCLALDPGFVVVGGGLMDHESTTEEFRKRYISILSEAAMPYLWPAQRATIKFAASELGELSQAIGAALVALYTAKPAA